MKRKVTLLLLLFCMLTLHAQEVYKTVKTCRILPSPRLTLTGRNVANWMSTIRWTKKIFPLSYGFMAVVWKAVENTSPRN